MDISIDLGASTIMETSSTNSDDTRKEGDNISFIEKEKNVTVQSTLDNQQSAAANVLSKYFESSNVNRSDDFFDSISTVKDNLDDDKMSSMRHRTISSSSEQICFEYENRIPLDTVVTEQVKEFEDFEGVEKSSEMSNETSVKHTHSMLESSSSQETFPNLDELKYDFSSCFDGMHEAWLFSDSTKRMIVSKIANPSYILDEEFLTKPHIIVEEVIPDPITELLSVHCPNISRTAALTLADVTHDISGLRKLLSGQAYRSAFNLTTIILNSIGQGNQEKAWKTPDVRHTPYSIQIWFTRILLLVKLKQHGFADVEFKQFGDFNTPDLCLEYYCIESEEISRGSLIPFGFRLIWAQFPQYSNKIDEALTRLSTILNVCRKIQDNLKNGLAEDGSGLQLTDKRRKQSLALWKEREIMVLHSIANALIFPPVLKDFPASLATYEEILKLDESRKDSLFACIGRLFLMAGDINNAKDYFSKTDVDFDINQGLLSIANNDFINACVHFEKAFSISSKNYVAVNNLAVCYLYQGYSSKALKLLQNMVDENPEQCLHEGVLFNLCTLYELESSQALEKKRKLLRCVNEYRTDGFITTSLKLPLTL